MMEQNCVEGDDNSADQMDDNLLEPLSEVSFCEREKTFTTAKTVAQTSINTTSADGKETDSTLPDARAKVLHLQRVQRGGASGSGSSSGSGSEMAARNSVSKARNKSGSGDKDNKDGTEKEEETVSLSLDSLIRCEVKSEKKRAANFKSNFTFGKPDDDISLRCNPSANFFYEHSNEPYSDDDTSDTYESSGERERPTERSKYGTKNIPATNGNGVNDHTAANPADVNPDMAASDDAGVGGAVAAAKKGKRGRPPLTEAERNERAARKEAIRLEQQNMLDQSQTMTTGVDDFMGHSIFHTDTPKKKRGRPPKNRYPQFLNSTTQSEQDAQDTSSTQVNESILSTHEFPPAKKRGRKPKSYYLEIAAAAAAAAVSEDAETTGDDSSTQNGTAPVDSGSVDMANQTISPVNDTLPLSQSPIVTATAMGPKKRGRKPKFLQNYYIKLEQQQLMPTMDAPKVLKKRGRKPKNFYLQQVNDDRANESAPAILETPMNPNYSRLQQSQQLPVASAGTSAQTSFDFDAYANKRGRRPKAYYEHLKLGHLAHTIVKQEGGSPLRPIATPTNTSIAQQKHIQSSADLSALSDDHHGEPPAKKKRGRKPKSYYLELQQQQAENQEKQTTYSSLSATTITSTSATVPTTASVTITNIQQHKGQINATASASAAPMLSSNFLPTRPFSKSTIVRPYIPYRPHMRRIVPQPRIFNRTGSDAPITGLVIKKKRGRKPKNYQPQMDEHMVGSSNLESNHELVDRQQQQQPESYQALDERNRVLFDLFEKRGDEIRILKQRISNLIDDNVEPAMDLDSMAWTNIELCKAFSLQRLNIPLFNYMREKFSIPMPSIKDVRKFVHNIQLVRGLQNTMLRILECDGKIHQEHEKLTILQVSYIKTAELFEYDEELDLIVGPNKYVTLIIARGLYKDWSQLVYFNVDTRVTKQNLNCVIEALHKIDYSVAALSSNFDEGKSDLFADLSINYGKGFLQHPITQEKIHCFYYLNDMVRATHEHFINGHLAIDENQHSKQPINKQIVMQAINKNYRRIPIPRELLAWTEYDVNNIDAIHTFFSQFTITLLRISSPDDRAAKNVAEFITIMKSYVELMSRPQCIDSDIIDTNFERYMEFQNKRLDKIHARLFKLDYINTISDPTRKKFREAMMMSIVSLKMLRKSVMSKYKSATFSTHAITNEIVKTKMAELSAKYNFRRLMAPTQVFRIIKDIFLGEDCSVKIESKVKFFFNGPVTAAEINGRNESYYVSGLIQYLCEMRSRKNGATFDVKDLKRKLKKAEELFCSAQNPNFRICENAVNKITKDIIDTNALESSVHEIIREYIVQRHLLRMRYFNENQITRIAMPVQMTINLEE